MHAGSRLWPSISNIIWQPQHVAHQFFLYCVKPLQSAKSTSFMVLCYWWTKLVIITHYSLRTTTNLLLAHLNSSVDTNLYVIMLSFSQYAIRLPIYVYSLPPLFFLCSIYVYMSISSFSLYLLCPPFSINMLLNKDFFFLSNRAD